MKIFKKLTVFILSAVLAFSFAACNGDNGGETTTEPVTYPPVTSAPVYVSKVAALYGPFGMASTILDQDRAYAFDVSYYSSFSQVTEALKNGSAELATLPLKTAISLYNETGGKIRILCVSNTNFLYVVQKGDSVQTLSDLNGKKVISVGKDTVNDKIINHILAKAGVSPEVEYIESYDELLESGAELMLLPEHYVSQLIFENSEYSVAVDFGAEWEKLFGTKPVQACYVATQEYVESHAQELNNFMLYYEVAVNFMNNIEAHSGFVALPLINQGFFNDPDLAISAVGRSGGVFITGEEMKTAVNSNIEQMLILDSDLAGITAPGDEIYYNWE